MASTTASAGNEIEDTNRQWSLSKDQIAESLGRLSGWLEKNDYRGYDTFDGLNAKYAAATDFRDELPADRASTGSAAISDQFAAGIGDSQKSFHEGHGLPG